MWDDLSLGRGGLSREEVAVRCWPCVFLWVYYSISTLTDELQSSLPDGVIQRNGVVATDALGTKYLAPTLMYVKA